MLTFNPNWRFSPPSDGNLQTAEIPEAALGDFLSLIGKISSQGRRWDIVEHFKGALAHASGASHAASSSEDWADTDLRLSMSYARQNAPLFLEGFWTACEELKAEGLAVPDVNLLNGLLARHQIGYVIAPPHLLLRESAQGQVVVEQRPMTIADEAIERLQSSLERSEQLLHEQRHREAVQETLWVLESPATAFRGAESADASIRGKYFNDIVRDLRRVAAGTTLARVLDWVMSLYGYLSSPTGGGVRHGLDLNDCLPMEAAEARLFCNLIRSYVSYLLAEHETLLGRTL